MAALRPGPVPPALPGYEVQGELGRGGMGVVYKARQQGVNRAVVVKVLLWEHAGPEQRRRFLLEAEADARVSHPNVLQVFQVGEHRGTPFLAMEYVDGGTLERKLGGKPLSPREAAAVVEVLAEAVAYAYSRGVVHRDLKPANVLLTGEGVLKVGDFGLARRLERSSRWCRRR